MQVSDPEIRWYRDNILEPSLNDMLSVPFFYTSPQEEWFFTLRSMDNQMLGNSLSSDSVTIAEENLHVVGTSSCACKSGNGSTPISLFELFVVMGGFFVRFFYGRLKWS